MAILSDPQANQFVPVRLSGPARMLWPLAVVMLLCLQGFLALTHEPFVDEWQALQLAVQSPDLAVLLQNLRYEGHPPLWHLSLGVFAAIAGPGHALAAAALVFGLGAQLLLLLRSPFPHWLRLLLALGEPLLFDFGVVSRSYTLGVFLIFACLVLWNDRRWFWVVLALLPLIEFLFGVISVGLLLIRFAERRPFWWPGVAIWVAASLIAAWTIIPPSDFVPVNNASEGVINGTLVWLYVLGSIAVPLQWADGPSWAAVPSFFFWGVLWVWLAVVLANQTRGRWADRAALGLFLVVTWAMFAFLYSLGIRHVLLLSVLLIAVVWRQATVGIAVGLPFRIWAVCGAASGLVAAAVSLTMPFDTASRAARFIVEHDLPGETWVSAPVQHGQGISAMTGVLFEGAGIECRSDAIRWNFAKPFTNSDQQDRWIAGEAAKGERFYLLSNIPAEASSGALLIDHVAAGYVGKDYYLYAINPNVSQRRSLRPDCFEGLDRLAPLGF